MLYKFKTSSQTTVSFIIGLILLAVVSAVCYVLGLRQALTEGFRAKTGFILENSQYGNYESMYLKQIFSCIAPMIPYAIAFWQVKGKADKHGAMSPDDGGTYVFKNWLLFALAAGLCAAVAGYVLFYFVLFRGESTAARLLIIKHNLWFIWVLQVAFTAGIFWLPFCKPLKKA